MNEKRFLHLDEYLARGEHLSKRLRVLEAGIKTEHEELGRTIDAIKQAQQLGNGDKLENESNSERLSSTASASVCSNVSTAPSLTAEALAMHTVRCEMGAHTVLVGPSPLVRPPQSCAPTELDSESTND